MFLSYIKEILKYGETSLSRKDYEILDLILLYNKASAYQIWKLTNQETQIAYKNTHSRIKKLKDLHLLEEEVTNIKNIINYSLTTEGLFRLIPRTKFFQKILTYYKDNSIIQNLVYLFFDESTIDYSTDSLNKLLRSYVIKCISLSNEHIRIMNEIDNENHTLIKRLCKGLEADLQRENNGLFFTIAMEIKLDSSRSFKIPSDVEIVIGEGKEEPLPLPVYPNTFVDIEPKSIRLFKVNGNEIEDERKIKFSQLMKGATIGLDTFYNDGGTERLDGIINSVNFRSRHDVKETTISLSFNKGREEGIKIREYFDRVEVKRYLINDPSFLRLRQDSKVHEKIKTMKKDFEIALDKMFP